MAWARLGPVGLLLLAALGGLLLSCTRRHATPPPEAPPWFEDVTDQVGLDFVHDAGPVDDGYFMPQIVGSGAALFDFDGDGRLDVLLLNNGGPKGRPNRLYKQMPDGKFKDVSKGSGLDFSGHCMGVAIGDVNNDGLPDVLITEFAGVRLFLNNGDGTFADVTEAAGLKSPLWATSAAFVDYDRDGWLDLVVVNYVEYDPSWNCAGLGGRRDYCHPNQFTGTVTKLFRNRGLTGSKSVRFEDRTKASGLFQRPGPGLGVACADFDGDGWPDIFVANDGKPNHLWINQKDGTFKEEALERGIACNGLGQAQANMGVALGDVDGDGDLDVFVTHLTAETHALWTQGPRGAFQDRTAQAGLARPPWSGTGFGTVLADFDHDGALDLAVVNGRVVRGQPANPEELGPFWATYAERNQLFANEGGGRFRDISSFNHPFCGTAGVSRGLVVGDVDGDGALDLLVTKTAGRARLYRNVAGARGHWLMVRAVDPALKRDAYGAAITIEAGGRRRVGWVNPGQSYLSSHDPRVHFGLGAAERVDAVQVLWPDGTREAFAGRPADQSIALRKGDGRR